MIEIDNIYPMDCLEGMRMMPDNSVDAVIADLPYGVLNRKNKSAQWDNKIPLESAGLRNHKVRLSCSGRASFRQN